MVQETGAVCQGKERSQTGVGYREHDEDHFPASEDGGVGRREAGHC